MEKRNEQLSISELYVIGKKKYCKHEEGLENWKTDLRILKSQLNSNDRKEQKKASEEISLWINTTHISFLLPRNLG